MLLVLGGCIPPDSRVCSLAARSREEPTGQSHAKQPVSESCASQPASCYKQPARGKPVLPWAACSTHTIPCPHQLPALGNHAGWFARAALQGFPSHMHLWLEVEEMVRVVSGFDFLDKFLQLILNVAPWPSYVSQLFPLQPESGHSAQPAHPLPFKGADHWIYIITIYN